ncbi:predicted protein [Sclerotinia sclerotiorum 1980 UF-70]|uniref:Uncharacterized protein n=1 Tax=Sclerotinia sclerotiorum (strain ATCC 18683 / 1980 / Ss-1) TaxID=665079 RepID=A7ERP9_SCLS1|nr:predicted protein [Sclerotinia sclerotiorum 1980 UF-70]EDN92141.1 predicted protein [Sclerotinia sclerotiorum 1980 UF-70]
MDLHNLLTDPGLSVGNAECGRELSKWIFLRGKFPDGWSSD